MLWICLCYGCQFENDGFLILALYDFVWFCILYKDMLSAN